MSQHPGFTVYVLFGGFNAYKSSIMDIWVTHLLTNDKNLKSPVSRVALQIFTVLNSILYSFILTCIVKKFIVLFPVNHIKLS